ncbi:hypothetical protein DYD21_19725 [Rhodohalobacter sp. SW132]|nr:hypothetical protein DYD21_19725 [Rhodohalobacter sp. SW132]
MQIFWTAGPVTSLGLIGGYYIGYGTMPSMQLLIYFVSFTVFSGIIGLVAKVVYDGTRGHLEEQSEKDILDVTDKLGDLILVARDKVVQAYEGEARQREAALQLLRRVDLTPYGVTIAFRDLTDDREVGEIMGQIFAYRRIGLQTKVRELYAEHKDKIDLITKDLNEKSPQAARELKTWFTGNTSGHLKYGVQREKYFLQRVMSAIENNNPYIMTFRDVEEMMILAFELISGREIPTLIFSYSGNWKYATTIDDLERKRSRYRVAQAKGGNRIRALAAYMVESGFESPDALPEGVEMNRLLTNVVRSIDRLSVKALRASRDPHIPQKELKRISAAMNTVLELYQMAREGYKESGKHFMELQTAQEKWLKSSSKSEGSPGTLQLGKGRRGIRIRESVIGLDEEARLEVCRHLAWYFEKEDIKKNSFSLFSSFDNRGAMSARRLAVEIAVALEPHINLSKPEIQRNINATKAIYLGGLSPDMSAAQKEELGRRMAAEADNGLGLSAIRLAETLVYQYNVELTDEAIDFLNYNYNAGRKSLHRVASKKKEVQMAVRSLQDIPPVLSDTKNLWRKALQEINKASSKL